MRILKTILLISILCLVLSCEDKSVFFKDALCIENITTIDAESGLKENQTVIIKDGKISQIIPSNDIQLSLDNKIIDGRGKFLIPGLWDAHIHFAYQEKLAPSMFNLFIANGITSVRDTGGEIHFVNKWKNLSKENPYTTPRVKVSGPLLDGMPNVYDGSSLERPGLSVGLSSVEVVAKEVQSLDSLGVDFLKAYEMLSPEQFVKIMQLAKEKNLKVTGHVPLSMDVISASNAGLSSMEHMRNLEFSLASNTEELLKERIALLADGKNDEGGILRSKIHQAQRQIAIENYDSLKAAEVFKVLKRNDTWQIPTLALYLYTASEEDFKYLPDTIKQQWLEGLKARKASKISKSFSLYRDWMAKMVGSLHNNNIEIMAGTDTPIGFLTPGLSLHEELNELVKCGLTPLEALKTATVNPAKYFNLENELGLIKENMWADLVILDANPLDNIQNTKRINAVIKQGNYMNRSKLDSLLHNAEKLN